MDDLNERGENYIVTGPGVEPQKPALTSPNGLDFEVVSSVNGEEAKGGQVMNSVYEEATVTEGPALTSIKGLEHLIDPEKPEDVATRVGASVLYLRVSTSRQMNTASDIDEDGNSIATQREWSMKKAKELGSPILQEFVDPGHSAQTIDKRPEFKKMLQFIDRNPDVKYVVIYMRSRVFRNHLDAAIVKRHLRAKGVGGVIAS